MWHLIGVGRRNKRRYYLRHVDSDLAFPVLFVLTTHRVEQSLYSCSIACNHVGQNLYDSTAFPGCSTRCIGNLGDCTHAETT